MEDVIISLFIWLLIKNKNIFYYLISEGLNNELILPDFKFSKIIFFRMQIT